MRPFYSIALTLLLVIPSSLYATPFIKLNLTLNRAPLSWRGYAEISSDTAESVTLLIPDAVKLVAKEKERYPDCMPDANVKPDDPRGYRLSLKRNRPCRVHFRIDVPQISTEEFTLTESFIAHSSPWHPLTLEKSNYQVSITAPPEWKFVTNLTPYKAKPKKVKEAAQTTTHSVYRAKSEESLSSVVLHASTRWREHTLTQGGITLRTLFFAKDEHLSDLYLKKSASYFKEMSERFGPSPFPTFTIAESVYPAGYSYEGYTLLGQSVVPLPFIPDTSLEHEIAHQWFGNGVRVKENYANWCEGLVTYLTDYEHAVRNKKSLTYRKDILALIEDAQRLNNGFRIADFKEPKGFSQRAVGYGGALYVFYLMEKRLGREAFARGLKLFSLTYRYKDATWEDLIRSVEKASGKGIASYVEPQIAASSLPDYSLVSQSFTCGVDKAGDCLFSFELDVQDPLPLTSIPVRVRTELSTIKLSPTIPDAQTLKKESGDDPSDKKKYRLRVSLVVDSVPTSITIDPYYELYRKLKEDERSPMLSDLMSASKIHLVLAPDEEEFYRPLIATLNDRLQAVTRVAKDSTPPPLTWESAGERIVVLGSARNFFYSLCPDMQKMPDVKNGATAIDKEPPSHVAATDPPANVMHSSSIESLKHPVSPHKRLFFIHADDQGSLQNLMRSYPHYKSYSSLSIKGNEKVKKTLKSDAGIVYPLYSKESYVKPPSLLFAKNIEGDVMSSRVVYIGEQHDRLAHHISQLNWIKRMHTQRRNFAIGMEMFSVDAQAALDRYIAGTTDEALFLKESSYFDVWGFDYRLYRPILMFARKNRIPVVALNIPRDAVKSVSRNGIDQLPLSFRKYLPPAMDLASPAYRKRLSPVFRAHSSSTIKPEYFIQAQMVWDESMAWSIHNYLKDHPDHKMIVLAGNGHIEFGQGIPSRVKRLGGYIDVSILHDANMQQGIADYILYPDALHLDATPSLGVLLEETEEAYPKVSPAGSDADSLRKRAVKVKSLAKEGVAAKGGVEAGDTLISFNGNPLQSANDIRIYLLYQHMDAPAALKVERNGKTLLLEIKFK